MDLNRSEDQELFRETTRRYLESSSPVATVRQWSEKEPAGYPARWWQQGAELGWTSLLVDEAHGGGRVSTNGLGDLVLVAEEIGRLVGPGPLVPVNLVASALGAVGTEDQRAEVLPGLLSGDEVAAWCLQEPGGRWDPAGIELEAAPTGDGFVLDGVKGPVEAGSSAGHLLVVGKVDGGLTQFLVATDSPGVSVTELQSLDLHRRFASVRFERVAVPAASVVGKVGEAADQVERQLRLAVVLQCAGMVGALDHMFTRTLEYAGDRYSFGRPLSSYQALKHRFADLKLWLEACHATATGAAQALATELDRECTVRTGELVSVAKSYIGDRGPLMLQDFVQLHGGIGVTWDHDLHLYLRRVVQDRSLYGTPEDHRERIADMMGMERAEEVVR